ncbi:MAG: pseudouridine-5'-phosphate glycosidase [Gemmataceae bacterium]|nr:pseudouridine-5'-phosphate glycosidase [Gemmataceae bacterium]
MRGKGRAIQIGPEVRSALAAGQAVVALETSVFVQGLPSPLHREAAHEVLALIRALGAVPALTAVLNGTAWVGLDEHQLEQLQTQAGVRKAGWRDLAGAMALGHHAATTVSAALALAHAAGIQVLATGGIGGVHRVPLHQLAALDVSADLIALTRFPLLVVCSGAKNLLDLPRTYELLETLSIPVVGWHTDRFPAFYVPDSGLPLSWRVDTLTDLIELWACHHTLRGSAVLVVQPCPAEVALSTDLCEQWLAQAETEAQAAGCGSAERTPFILRRLAELSGGRTLLANRALLVANARLAAQIAIHLQSFTSNPTTD